MQSTMSATAKADLCQYLISDFEERSLTCTVVVGGRGHTWVSLRSHVRSAGPADVEDVLTQLNLLDDETMRADRVSASHAKADEQQRAVAGGAQAVRDQARAMVSVIEATVAARAANTVEARRGRVEALLERVATALEKR